MAMSDAERAEELKGKYKDRGNQPTDECVRDANRVLKYAQETNSEIIFLLRAFFTAAKCPVYHNSRRAADAFGIIRDAIDDYYDTSEAHDILARAGDEG